MKKHLIQELETSIHEKIKATKKDIKSFEALTRPISPDNAIGRLTRMDAINSRSINEAALQKAKQSLSQLEHSLIRLKDPDFGLCIECEEQIPLGRLRIMPETRLCVKCAEKYAHTY
jgi:DnaK suppressor protein